jgi:hypothetical protein
MSQQTSKPKQPELGAAMMDVLRRPVDAGATPGLAAIVNGGAVAASVSAPVVEAQRPVVEAEIRPTKKPAVSAESSESAPRAPRRAPVVASVRERFEFEIETGRGTKSVTFRVPKELAGKLKLMAVQRQLSGEEGPRTINEIGMAALTDWIERNAA